MNNPMYHMEGIQSQNEKIIEANNNQNNLMMEQIGNNINMMNYQEHNEQLVNQGMNMGGINPFIGNPNLMYMNNIPGMNNIVLLHMMKQQQMTLLQQMEQLQMNLQMEVGMGMPGIGMGGLLQNNMMPFGKEIEIKEYLSKLYGKNMDILFNSIYFNIISKKEKCKENYGYKLIKLNFYDTILDIKFYDKFYICALIEYIFDDIFGEIHEKVYIGERKYEYQTTQEIIQNPIIEYIKIRKNDYSDYLYLEYNGKNLDELENKTCEEIGLKSNDVLFLKFKKPQKNNEIKIEEDVYKNKDDKNIYKNFRRKKKNLNYDDYAKSSNDTLKINVEFKSKKEGKDEIIKINIEEYKSIKDLMEIYFEEIGQDFEDLKNFEFLFNSKKLECSSESVGKLFNNPNNVTINVVDKRNQHGLDSRIFDFVDVTSSKTKKQKVAITSDQHKIHREIYKGLNIFGICQNKNCSVKGKEVIYKIKLKKEGLCFNVKEESEKIICPVCKTKFEKRTSGFWRCEYQFVGFYYDCEKGKNIVYNSEPHETHENEFEYFDPDENGLRKWNELLIFVLPRQKIKYKK